MTAGGIVILINLWLWSTVLACLLTALAVQWAAKLIAKIEVSYRDGYLASFAVAAIGGAIFLTILFLVSEIRASSSGMYRGFLWIWIAVLPVASYLISSKVLSNGFDIPFSQGALMMLAVMVVNFLLAMGINTVIGLVT